MKIKLVLMRTENNGFDAWTAVKIIDVEIPLDAQDDWQIVGAEWPEQEGQA